MTHIFLGFSGEKNLPPKLVTLIEADVSDRLQLSGHQFANGRREASRRDLRSRGGFHSPGGTLIAGWFLLGKIVVENG